MHKHHLSLKLYLLILALLFSVSCNSSTKDLLDLAFDKPSRKTIDASRTGVNNFFIDREFGSISAQYSEIQDTLGLRFIRILIAWTDAVQPSPSATPNYSLFDDIINAAPAGVDILVVVSHTPAWMLDSANWVDGDPRKTWVERWLRPTVRRYAGNPRIIGWEVFNEPNVITVNSDSALGLVDPGNYVELLRQSSAVIRQEDPSKLVVLAATTSIQQGFPDALDYNKEMQELGAESLVDIWGVHYYGEQFEKVVQDNGVANFLNTVSNPIWITESGEQGTDKQLAYVETTWPFLREKIPGIDRIYYYQFGEPGGSVGNYGLKTTDPAFPVSDLYVYLRDR